MASSQISRDDCIAYITEFPSMREYLDNNSPHDPFGLKSVTREKAARAYMAEMKKNDGLDLFNIYEQDSEVVRVKRDQAADANDAATCQSANNGRRAYRCSLCPGTIFRGGVSDFTRHNRTRHTLDPSEAIYCPHPGCGTVIRRDGDLEADVHLAKHGDYRNLQGHGGTLLDAVPDFGSITPDTVLQAAMRQKCRINDYMARVDQYVQHLGNRLPSLHMPPQQRQFLQDDVDQLEILAYYWGDFTQEQKEYRKQVMVSYIMEVRRFLSLMKDTLERAEELMM